MGHKVSMSALCCLLSVETLACGTSSSPIHDVLPPVPSFDPNAIIIDDPNQQTFVAAGQPVVVEFTVISGDSDGFTVGPTFLGTPTIDISSRNFKGEEDGFTYKKFTWTTEGISPGLYPLKFTQSPTMYDPSSYVSYLIIMLGTQ